MRNFREEEAAGKRRQLEPWRSDNFEARNQGNQSSSVHYRLGGIGRRENQFGGQDEGNWGRNQNMDNRGGGKPRDLGICYWCRQDGHHQADCTKPPFCFRCKETGHIAARCPTAKGASLHMCGYGFPGQGFYCLKIPGPVKQQPIEYMGLISVEKGEASESRIEEELKHLIDGKWEWKVRKIAENEYLATFPDKQILETLSKSNGVSMALYNIWAKISMSTMNSAASTVLQTGWVLMHNVPDKAKSVEAVTLIAELAGDVVVVDEMSLIREGPIRVKLKVRELTRVRGFVEIFIEGIGYEVRFVPEDVRSQQKRDPPRPPPKKPDDFSEDLEDDDLLDSDEDRAPRKASGKRHTRSSEYQHKGEQSKSKQLDAMEAELETQKEGSPALTDPSPIAVFDPSTGKMTKFTELQEDTCQDEDIPVSQVDDDNMQQGLPKPTANQIVVHCEGGGYKIMDKTKWPILKLRDEDMEGIEGQITEVQAEGGLAIRKEPVEMGGGREEHTGKRQVRGMRMQGSQQGKYQKIRRRRKCGKQPDKVIPREDSFQLLLPGKAQG
ncbi:unnamed protein product [Urochloa decumbens]|uniref:CCHC-type domain-containing protein n=1 Tax=Urochloa decumbens TaxID=240449 RepID=A0ABC9AZV5_9POAL